MGFTAYAITAAPRATASTGPRRPVPPPKPVFDATVDVEGDMAEKPIVSRAQSSSSSSEPIVIDDADGQDVEVGLQDVHRLRMHKFVLMFPICAQMLPAGEPNAAAAAASTSSSAAANRNRAASRMRPKDLEYEVSRRIEVHFISQRCSPGKNIIG